MKKITSTFCLKSLLLLFITVVAVFSFEGRPWIDENGNETGLINLNPDSTGEPWLAGYLDSLSEDELRDIRRRAPEMVMNRRFRSELPEEVILLDNDEFPEVFHQIGNSCGQASGIGYAFSYQYNVITNSYADDSTNRAYGFTYNYLNEGRNIGSWYYDGWEILKNVGAPSVKTFGSPNGSFNGTEWMNGANKWHNSNNNRVTGYQRITVESMEDIEKIKSWLYDLNGTDPHKKGGCVLFAANSGSSTPNSTVQEGDHAGDALSSGLTGRGMDHAMTFAGYSDNVAGGALLLVNSWGKSWGSEGYTWVPYSTVINGGLYEDEVYLVTVGKHAPKLELRATVTSSSTRNSLVLRKGFANGSASTPDTVTGFGKAFNKSGGTLNLQGQGGSSSLELSLDISEFYDDMTGSEATFFLQVEGSATVSNLTLVDYTGVTVKEYPAGESSVEATGTTDIPITFTRPESLFEINTVVHGNGTASAEGVKVIEEGANYTFTFMPDRWFTVDSVVVNGVNIGSTYSYELTSVSESQTIHVYFGWDSSSPNVYSLIGKSSENGILSLSGKHYAEEYADTTIEIIPNEWHPVDSVLIDGISYGPIHEITFTNLLDSHSVEVFFGEENYTGEHELWKPKRIYGNGKKDTVSYTGHLWECSYWNSGKEPGFSQEWRDLGEEIIEQTDTVVISHLEHRASEYDADSIIITTYSIFNGDTSISTSVIAEQTVNVQTVQTAPALRIIQGGKQFYAPTAGHYSVALYDLRGRVIFNRSVRVQSKGMTALPFQDNSFSKGIYLMRISNKQFSVIDKIRF